MKSYYCKDGVYHYKNELPKSLQPFVDYVFSSGGIAGDDFNSFNTKYKNAIEKLLPEGFEIVKWIKGHYYCSCFIKNNEGKFIYLSISDVRYDVNDWFKSILIRQVKYEKDYTGSFNVYTTLFTLTKELNRLYR